MVFKKFCDNQLFANLNKYTFRSQSVEYLGYYISMEGVSTDPKKIKVIKNWPGPTHIKQLQGFLGLAGYYRRFIKGFGMISKPLTELLKKGAFQWSDKAQVACDKLKAALTYALVLTLPYNEKLSSLRLMLGTRELVLC